MRGQHVDPMTGSLDFPLRLLKPSLGTLEGNFLFSITRTSPIALAVFLLHQIILRSHQLFLALAHFMLPILKLLLEPVEEMPDFQLGSAQGLLGIHAEITKSGSKVLDGLNRGDACRLAHENP